MVGGSCTREPATWPKGVDDRPRLRLHNVRARKQEECAPGQGPIFVGPAIRPDLTETVTESDVNEKGLGAVGLPALRVRRRERRGQRGCLRPRPQRA
jgi:hypothetical protein